MELRWVASASASGLYAAALIARGDPLVDLQLGEAIAPASEDLASYCSASGLPVGQLFAQLVPLAAGIENDLQLATTALGKCAGSETAKRAATGLASHIAQLESAFRRAKPDAADELALRGEPLREQWEARGPGLLKTISRLTEPQFLAEEARVVLVHPLRGGAGEAFIPSNTVVFEAVLANPHAELPEVVRLAWLLAQMNLDLPVYQGTLMRDRAVYLGRLALLPATLEAAQEVELTMAGPSQLPAAAAAWHLGELDAEGVMAWWETYRAGSLPWSAAIAALDRMLA